MNFLKYQEDQGFVKELGRQIWTSFKSCISALISNVLNPVRKKEEKKYCTWGRTWPIGGGPSPWDMQSAGLLQSYTLTPIIFLFLVREILIWLLPDKDCVETVHKDMCSP